MPQRRRRRIAISASVFAFLLLGGTAAAIALWPELPADGSPVEMAFVEPETHWPPQAPASLEAELASTEASQRLAAAAERAFDAGPPILIEGDMPGMLVRTGVDRFYYIEVVLGAESFDALLPMAVLIHGRGDRARLPGGPFLELRAPLRVIVPQAPDRLGDGYQWLPVRVGQHLTDQLTTSLLQRAGELAAMIRALSQGLPTLGRPIVCGFSQGGMLALTMATHFSDVVGWAFPLAGWLPPALVPPYRRQDVAFPRIRSMHGTSDEVIPLSPTREVYETLRERGFEADLVPIEGARHEMTGEMDAQLHLWIEEALGLQVQEAIAAGVLDGGVSDDGGLDGGIDAGVRRGRRRAAPTDAAAVPAHR